MFTLEMDTPKKLCYNIVLLAIICFMYSSMSDANCSLPEDLTNTVWEYTYTEVAGNSEQSTNLNIANKRLINSVINLNVFGTSIDDWTCINSLHISNSTSVVVFKSDTSFTSGPFLGSRWLYLCMKLTKVTADLYYFHFLSDIFNDGFPNERVFASVDGNPPNNNDPVCSTFCQYTESPKIRTLRRQGTNDTLPNDASLCEPCNSSCFEDASCDLPDDLKNTVWEYNYTVVSHNSEQSTNLNIANTTLPNSVINLNALGTTVNNWTCINSLEISGTTAVVVFKGDESFTRVPGGHKVWLYLCMKLTKVDPDLYYFHLLSDIETALFPNERVFMSEANNAPADNASICSTFCQYTESLKIRTLRRQGSSATLPSNVSLCEPCDSACEEATTKNTLLETTQKTTLSFPSTEIDITTDITSTETTQKTTIPSTSTEIVTTSEMQIPTTTSEITLQTTSTSSEIETTTEIISTTTRPETKLPSTPNQMETTTEITLKETTQTSAVHYTVIDLETTPQTTIHSTSKDTKSTTNMKVTTTDLKDKTTLETKSTDTENLKRYSGPIILAGISLIGFVLVIIVFCLLNGRSMNNTERITHTKSEETYGSTPETCYTLYKGKQFGFQKIAIQHWDYH